MTVITKGDRNFLQIITGITKCHSYYSQSAIENYYKVWHVLQSATVITKLDVTPKDDAKKENYKFWKSPGNIKRACRYGLYIWKRSINFGLETSKSKQK